MWNGLDLALNMVALISFLLVLAALLLHAADNIKRSYDEPCQYDA